jgi:dTDP-4-dehydrorhamnose 3,5-epimerase
MDVTETTLPDVLLIQPRVFRDERGSFLETWRRERYAAAGLPETWVQDNAAVSTRGVLRGLHYQHPHAQGKLVMALHGEVFDVAVDIRPRSSNFGRWYGATLSADNGHQLWIPPGFAHGYLVTSDVAVFAYKCTTAYHREGDAAVAWDDPDIGIRWPAGNPRLSPRDAAAPRLRDIDRARLPDG